MTNRQAVILVVMPAYNSAATISDAIKSILDQSHQHIRLHIVDDNSTDDTYAIAKQYERYPRVKVFRNSENRGAYYSRNAGLYYGRGNIWQFFTAHDADDISHRGRYERILRAFRDPSLLGVQDHFSMVSHPEGVELGSRLAIGHAVYRKSVFTHLGYFHEVRFGADWEYWHRLTNRNRQTGHRTHAIQQVLGTSYIHGQNLTVQIPIGSPERRAYIAQIRRDTKVMAKTGQFYRDIDAALIQKVTTR